MSTTAGPAAIRPGDRRPTSARVRRRRAVLGLVLVATLVALAVGLASMRAEGERPLPAAVPSASPTPSTPPADQNRTVRLAFGGDVHFEGVSRAALSSGLPTVGRMLVKADVAMVNLETAITTRGDPAPKQFVFRAPPRALDVLTEAGVDVVTLANNHGMDYGRTGLDDTLRAAAAAKLPLIGAGLDADAAFAPWTRTVRGLEVAVFAATDVLDTFAQNTWVAGPSTSGLASAKDPARLLAAVRAAGQKADVVVVYLHWGQEMATCPSERQRSLARQLAAAGADVIVGSHAHVLQPGGRVAGAYVHYGLGNFVFYARTPQTRQTGVLTVDVGARGVRDARWTPATIRSGVPVADRAASAPVDGADGAVDEGTDATDGRAGGCRL
jgi:poly-gamma-glutamate capsule biosynthesis protein CapA/YwtB (metallophosphatase superfamily)